MATSRYAVTGSTSAPKQNSQSSVNQTTTGSQSGSQSSTTNSNQTSNTASNQTTTTNQTTQNFTPQQQALLQQLLGTLATGGTSTMKRQQAQRDAEIQRVQGARNDFDKEDAFGDAQGLMSQQLRRALEQALPAISRAAEDAGSSGGALRALLVQDASQRAAESSAALGAQQAVQYGNINANFSAILERLTQVNDPAAQLLVQALNVAKGGTQTTTGTTTVQGTSATNTQGTSTTNQSSQQSSQQNTNQNSQTNYGNFTPVATQPSGSDLYFGALPQTNVDPTRFVGTTVDTLAQLANGNQWSSYRI